MLQAAWRWPWWLIKIHSNKTCSPRVNATSWTMDKTIRYLSGKVFNCHQPGKMRPIYWSTWRNVFWFQLVLDSLCPRGWTLESMNASLKDEFINARKKRSLQSCHSKWSCDCATPPTGQDANAEERKEALNAANKFIKDKNYPPKTQVMWSHSGDLLSKLYSF